MYHFQCFPGQFIDGGNYCLFVWGVGVGGVFGFFEHVTTLVV